MIVTVTPNPSIDRTVTLSAPLTRGAVHRVSSVTTEPGGKGVNVARALMLAGLDAVAVLPAPANDPLVAALQASAVPFRCVPSAGAVRTNLAITELLEPYPCRVAIDTSERPLAALVESFDRAAPDLIKPNAEELAGVLGHSPQALEAAVAQGDPEPVVSAARRLVDRGVRAVLATLGAAGAVLVDETGSWMATPAPIVARSTVGAGDASLAGYIRADVGGAVPPQRLQMAVAYGRAAAALPGSALPTPAQVDLDAVRVTPIAPNTKVSP
jgi:1-phosphofructokinase